MDSVSAANASISQSIAAQSVTPARCRNCRSARVAWVTSKRTGTAYLADAIAGSPGKVIPLPHRPHFKTCDPEAERQKRALFGEE